MAKRAVLGGKFEVESYCFYCLWKNLSILWVSKWKTFEMLFFLPLSTTEGNTLRPRERNSGFAWPDLPPALLSVGVGGWAEHVKPPKSFFLQACC